MLDTELQLSFHSLAQLQQGSTISIPIQLLKKLVLEMCSLIHSHATFSQQSEVSGIQISGIQNQIFLSAEQRVCGWMEKHGFSPPPEFRIQSQFLSVFSTYLFIFVTQEFPCITFLAYLILLILISQRIQTSRKWNVILNQLVSTGGLVAQW